MLPTLARRPVTTGRVTSTTESFWVSVPGHIGATGTAGVAIATAAQVEDGITTGQLIAGAAATTAEAGRAAVITAAAGRAVIRMVAEDLLVNPMAVADPVAVNLTAVEGLAVHHMAAAATARTKH